MARTVRDSNLETRAARLRLPQRPKPYRRAIERGAHLQYYRGARGGAWGARWYVGEGKYRETTFGAADDVLDADGVAVLSFRQAQEAARAWFAQQARRDAGLDAVVAGPYTVS